MLGRHRLGKLKSPICDVDLASVSCSVILLYTVTSVTLDGFPRISRRATRPALGLSCPDHGCNSAVILQAMGDHQKQRVARLGGCAGDSSERKYRLSYCNGRLTTKVFLIIFTAMVYEATMHGFGMRVVDIKRTGGDLRTAMKVRSSLVFTA